MDKKTIIDIAFDSIIQRTNSIDEVSTINRGSYSLPLTPGVKYFKKNELAPYEIQVSKYDSADLAFDSYDTLYIAAYGTGLVYRTQNSSQNLDETPFIGNTTTGIINSANAVNIAISSNILYMNSYYS